MVMNELMMNGMVVCWWWRGLRNPPVMMGRSRLFWFLFHLGGRALLSQLSVDLFFFFFFSTQMMMIWEFVVGHTFAQHASSFLTRCCLVDSRLFPVQSLSLCRLSFVGGNVGRVIIRRWHRCEI